MKVLQIMTRNSYTVEGLYEAIKDKKFTAGQPMYTIHCSYPIITFPAVDKRNQVWITPSAYGECNLFYIQKQEEAGGGRRGAATRFSGREVEHRGCLVLRNGGGTRRTIPGSGSCSCRRG